MQSMAGDLQPLLHPIRLADWDSPRPTCLMQIVSLWANLLGGVFPLLSAHYGYNPAVTSAPLMTTVVDSTGLLIYFLIAKWIMRI